MKTINLLLFVTAVATITSFNSCKKDPIDDCIGGICPCEDTIYYTRTIVIDTFVMDEAEYIYPPEFVVDTFDVVHIDTFQYGNFRAVMPQIVFKLLLNEEDSISFVYRGGVRGYIAPEPVPDPVIWGCDLTNSVFVAKDTVYRYREHLIPYAILEVFEGSESYIDTAFYPVEFSLYHYANFESLLIDISVVFANNGFTTDAEKFDEYLKGYYNIGNTGYYFTDVFPSMEWESDLTYTDLILFKNN